MSGWDLALVASVTAMVVVMAVLRTPRRKALVMAFPIPFTVASIALGEPVTTTHVAALTLLFAYTLGVWALHRLGRVPLIAAILVSAAGFVTVAAVLAPMLPRTEAAFWMSIGATAMLAVALLALLRPSDEEPDRRRLPLPVKIPVIVLVVTFLVWIKDAIGGFMTLFPMVGVLASYENRRGLWSNVRQIPVVMLSMLPLMVTSHVTVDAVGLAGSLVIGWVPLLLVLVPFLRRAWLRVPAALDAAQSAPPPRGAKGGSP